MRTPTLSILGLYNYSPDVLDELKVPESLDLENIKNNILVEYAEMGVIYQDADFFKKAVGLWCGKMLPVWEKLEETLNYEYNPLWNKDAYYSETIERDKDTTSEVQDNATGSSSGTSEHDTAGFNSDDWARSTLDKVNGNTTDNRNTTGAGTEDETVKSERREYGNIGVTTTMQLIQEQRDLVEFNLVQRILDDFKQRFLLMVY